MTTCRLRTLDQAEAAQFVAEVKDFCACCQTEIYPEAVAEQPRFIEGLGDVCLRCYLAEVESGAA